MYNEPPWAASDYPYDSDWENQDYQEEATMPTCPTHSDPHCQDPDCFAVHDDPPTDPLAITHEVVTGKPMYHVNDYYVGTTHEEVFFFMKTLLQLNSGTVTYPDSNGIIYQDVSIKIVPPTRSTLTLYPVEEVVNDKTRPYIATVYLHAGKMREAGFKIVAIKHYRQATGVGLKEAKDAIEQNEIVPLGDMHLGTARILSNLLDWYIVDKQATGKPVGPVLYCEKPF